MNYILVFSFCLSLQFSLYLVAARGIQLRRTLYANSLDPTRVTQLSWRPRVFYYDGFLSDEECDHLINTARSKLEKSMVVDDKTGESLLSDVRTSSGTYFEKAQDKVIANIEARIAAWTFIPEEHGETMQVLRYELNQYYVPHYDSFVDKKNLEFGGNRIATVLLYLSDVEKGGETVFPKAQARMSQPKNGGWSDCAKDGKAVKPNKGDALLFFNLHNNGTIDSVSEHGSCPVISGEKWSATMWLHILPVYQKWENIFST